MTKRTHDNTTQLSTIPGSSTPAQRSRLVVEAKRQGFDIDEIRSMVGGSVKQLSCRAASGWIKHFGGGDLPNPPGEKPSAYKGKPQPGTVRMITDDHVDQIASLLSDWARGDLVVAFNWLSKNFKISLPDESHWQRSYYAMIRQLGTAERAGQVIRVLKGMIARRNHAQSPKRERGVCSEQRESTTCATR